MAKALAETYQPRGLTKPAIIGDARKFTDQAGPCDIWSFTPPCEPFSKRNHERSEQGLIEAGRQLVEMLWYPRMWSPKIILVENVNEPCRDRGPPVTTRIRMGHDLRLTRGTDSWMSRDRFMWIGVKSGGE